MGSTLPTSWNWTKGGSLWRPGPTSIFFFPAVAVAACEVLELSSSVAVLRLEMGNTSTGFALVSLQRPRKGVPGPSFGSESPLLVGQKESRHFGVSDSYQKAHPTSDMRTLLSSTCSLKGFSTIFSTTPLPRPRNWLTGCSRQEHIGFDSNRESPYTGEHAHAHDFHKQYPQIRFTPTCKKHDSP